jgi:hypothetical protein
MIASFATKYCVEGIAMMIVKLTLKQNCNSITDILIREVNEMGA